MRDFCHSPNPTRDVQVKLLHEACIKAGGELHLAAKLGVDVDEISAWLDGEVPVPDGVFLACLDIVRPESRI
jgi:hypothetical protein